MVTVPKYHVLYYHCSVNQQKSELPNLLGKKKRFTILLIALLVLFLVLPLFSGYQKAFAVANDLMFSMVMFAAIYALSENRKYMDYALLLGLPAILLRWLFWVYPEQYLWVASFFLA